MIEIRSFAGDAAELSEFVNRAWRAWFEGAEIVPVSDAAYFDWLFFQRPGFDRDLLVAAYDGDVLVGALLAFDVPHGGRRQHNPGAFASWLTIDPGRAEPSVAIRMVLDLRRRLGERGIARCLGFALAEGSGSSQAMKFWKSAADAFDGAIGFHHLVRFSIRVIDADAMAAFSLDAWERRGTNLWRLLPLGDGRSVPGIRPYQPSDLPRCERLLQETLGRVDCGFDLAGPNLAHQLSYGDVASTWVYCEDDVVMGWVNYHRLQLLGREPAMFGFVDQIVMHRLGRRQRRLLMKAALRGMRTQGLAAALALVLPAWPHAELTSVGFLPTPGGYHVVHIDAPQVDLPSVTNDLYIQFH